MSETFNAVVIGLLWRRCLGLAGSNVGQLRVLSLADSLIFHRRMSPLLIGRGGGAQQVFPSFNHRPDTAEELRRVSRSPLARR